MVMTVVVQTGFGLAAPSASADAGGDGPGVAVAAGPEAAASDEPDAVTPAPGAASISVAVSADHTQVFAPGEDVTFTIAVTNDGAEPVEIRSLVDSVRGDLDGAGSCAVPQTIEPAAGYACAFTVFVAADEHAVVKARGVAAAGGRVSGAGSTAVEVVAASIDIETATNGEDADAPPGPAVRVGSTVEWTHVVTNTGDVVVRGITVTDDRGVSLTCSRTRLAPGRSLRCVGSGLAAGGPYATAGKVAATATDADGHHTTVRDRDRSHYLGVDPAITLVKAFAGEVLAAGESSALTLTVRNGGDVDLSDVTVTDVVDARLAVTGVECPGTAAVLAQSVACTLESLPAGATAEVSIGFVAAPGAPAATPVAPPDGDVTCRSADFEPNADGVCTSTSIRPVASCWAPDGTQVVEIVNTRSETIVVWWHFLGESGRVSAPPGSTFLALAGGPSSGELRVEWGRDRQSWSIGITAAACDSGPATIVNTAFVTAMSPVGPVEAQGSASVTLIPGAGENVPPTAAFTAACVQLTCAFADESSDPDGEIVAWRWDFGDGGTSEDPSPTHAYPAAGVYPVTLTVTDDAGTTGTHTRDVIVAPMHVGDLDGILLSFGEAWDGTVEITIVAGTPPGGPVAGALVEGVWALSGPASCTTGPDGKCRVAVQGVTADSETFTVTDVTHPDHVYDPSANTDPDGDSDGTSIDLVDS